MGCFLIISILAVRVKYPFKFEDICKQMGSVVDDDDRKQYVYYTEKMNEVRSYLVFQSKEIDNRRTYLRNEIAFYDFGKKA